MGQIFNIAGPFWATTRPGGIVVLLHWPSGTPDLHNFAHFGQPVLPNLWASAICNASAEGEENGRWYQAMEFHGATTGNVAPEVDDSNEPQWDGRPPTLEEVLAAGYSPEAAAKIVDQENAKFQAFQPPYDKPQPTGDSQEQAPAPAPAETSPEAPANEPQAAPEATEATTPAADPAEGAEAPTEDPAPSAEAPAPAPADEAKP